MSKRSKRAAGFPDPTQLPPFESKDAEATVIIETPKGNRHKYAYDPKERIFELRKVLPAGMTFHYDCGFRLQHSLAMATRWMCWCSWTSRLNYHRLTERHTGFRH